MPELWAATQITRFQKFFTRSAVIITFAHPANRIRQKVQIRMLDTATNNHYVWNLVEIGGLNTPHSLSPTQSYTQSGDNGILDNEGTTAKPIILCP